MAVGQLTTATLSGEVQDNTGALVPKAHITVVNTDTGFTQSTDSNDRGAWRIDLLPVGGYRLTIKAEGFKSFAQAGIVLSLGQFATVNAALQIGDTSETISITSDVPLVNVSNSVVGATVQNSEIVNLPIVNRNVYDLLTLVPGVQTNTTSYTLGYPQQTVQIAREHVGYVLTHIVVTHRRKSRSFPGLRIAFDDERARRLIELV